MCLQTYFPTIPPAITIMVIAATLNLVIITLIRAITATQNCSAQSCAKTSSCKLAEKQVEISLISRSLTFLCLIPHMHQNLSNQKAFTTTVLRTIITLRRCNVIIHLIIMLKTLLDNHKEIYQTEGIKMQHQIKV